MYVSLCACVCVTCLHACMCVSECVCVCVRVVLAVHVICCIYMTASMLFQHVELVQLFCVDGILCFDESEHVCFV